MNEFGELRSLLQSPYSPALWDEVCAWLEVQDATLLERDLIPYASSILSRWPLDSRPIPMAWHTRLLAHGDPGRFPTDHPGAAGHYIRAAGSITLSGRGTQVSRPNDLRRLARSPFVGDIEGLTLEDLTLLPEDVDALCDEPSLDDLRALTFRRTSPDPRRLSEIFSRRVWRLSHLAFRGIQPSPDVFSILADHPSNASLTRLDLGLTLLDDDAILTLARSLPPSLEHLDLSCVRASREALLVLLDALSELTELRHLDLFGADVYPRDLDALDARVHVPRSIHPQGVTLVTYDLGPRFGGMKARTFEKADVTIGRGRNDDVYIPHGAVTRQHAFVQRQGNVLTMVDGQTSNGVLINRVRLEGSVVLTPEDTAYVGPAYVKVDIVSGTF